jgi:hypothetical protein
MTDDPWNKAVRRLTNNPESKAVFAPSPALAVGEPSWTEMYEWAKLAAARISQLEAGLESIAKNTCCDKCQEAALVARALLKGQS